MAETRETKLLIIGSGPAGYTAGVYASRAMLNPILVQGIEPGGQLTTTTEVENWPGDSEVQGPDLMIRMQDHAKAMGTEIIGDIITDLDLSSRPFHAKGDSGTTYVADAVILATPNFTHHPITVAAARARKHVMCEKPLGLDAQQVREMYHAARDAQITHMTAFTYRFAPAMRYLRHLLIQGHLGEPRHFRSQRFLDLP